MINELIFILSFAILGSYLAFIHIIRKGWKQIPLFLAEETPSSAKNVSVVVACRNEAENLPHLLEALKKQSLSDFQLILINDHSEDNTLRIMQNAATSFENLLIINAFEKGKKFALQEGISAADGSLIVTTDADCIPPKKWIETILAFQTKHNCDLIIGSVKMEEDKSLFSQVQALEFSTLIASGAGAAGSHMPIMCNGANLAFSKKAWQKSSNDLKTHELSGDDIFLLLSIKKNGGKIRLLKSEKTIVKTKTAKTMKAFLVQRKRWTSKSKSYNDLQIILVAILVFLSALAQITLLLAGLFDEKMLLAAAVFFILKYASDWFFMWSVNDFFKTKDLARKSFLLSLVYPFYISYSALSGLLTKTVKWK